MKGKKKSGIGLSYAINGIAEAIKRERNFRIHLWIALIVVIAGIYVRLSSLEWIFIIIAIHMVLITELINSVIERIIDYLRPEYHPKAKIIKDVAAGIVLLSAITSVIIGVLIFWPKLL